jgi:hypothetical protein
VYFSQNRIFILRGSDEDTWQYLDVYNEKMTRKYFSYAKETSRNYFIDSVVENRIYLSIVVFDYYQSNGVKIDTQYELFQKGSYDLYTRKIHLLGSALYDDKYMSFIRRNGNSLYFKKKSDLADTVVDLRDISLNHGEVLIRTAPRTTCVLTPVNFSDSTNFDLFVKSLLPY